MKRYSFFFAALLGFCSYAKSQQAGSKWFSPYQFNAKTFVLPSTSFAPLTRWWWPGNDVTTDELRREINLFADKGFGGVEIQPFAMVFPAKGIGQSDRIMSYDSPSYYQNLKSVMETAKKRGIVVDLTDGSGWPAGGPHLTEKDNNLTLEFGWTNLYGGRQKSITLPRPIRQDRPDAVLRAVIAAKILQDDSLGKGPVLLDPKTAIDISDNIKDSTLTWQAPAGKWKIISFWSMPDMERPSIIAKRDAGFVMNHFDSIAVIKNYQYLFGDRTGLQPYFGNPLRAVFDDSYEFRANRHFADNFFDFFQKRRGYNLKPWLPANMWMGYNNMYARMNKPGAKPDFIFSSEDWRIRYDYDLTLGELLGEQFLKPVSGWLNSRKLLHRTQPYGFHMDVIATAGLADIPELETMNSIEAAYKMITSGAHLYNRPLISCETGVFINRAFMTTPQKLRITIDKALASGVNQIVYHGTPYRYFPQDYPAEGWYPWTNAGLKTLDFSSNIGESDPYWKFIKDINDYVARAQYALRSGKPQADVLLYFPFLDFDESQSSPNELLLKGVFEDIEPPITTNEAAPDGYHIPYEKQWYKQIWPVINALDAAGITWDWVNDVSIQQATVSRAKEINIRGNHYKALIIANAPFIQLATAKKLQSLSQSQASLLAVGNLPVKQPGYYDCVTQDSLTKVIMTSVWQKKNTMLAIDALSVTTWLKNLRLPLHYQESYPFLRQTRRAMENGDLLQFIWNQSEQWQSIDIKTDKSFRDATWMDASNGTSVSAVPETNGIVHHLIPPYSSVFLQLKKQATGAHKDHSQEDLTSPGTWKPLTVISSWHLRSDSLQVDTTELFDWRNHPVLKGFSSPGIYTSSFSVAAKQAGSHYLIDLGKVYFTAEVKINGTYAGKRIYAPYTLDITPLIKEGTNTIEVSVIPTSLNRFIAEANKGNKLYRQFKDKKPMAAGMKGPVVLYKALQNRKTIKSSPPKPYIF